MQMWMIAKEITRAIVRMTAEAAIVTAEASAAVVLG